MFHMVESMSDPMIGVRMKAKDKALLGRVCEARREDVSDFVRRAVRRELAALGYLSEGEMKALGVKPEKQAEVGGLLDSQHAARGAIR